MTQAQHRAKELQGTVTLSRSNSSTAGLVQLDRCVGSLRRGRAPWPSGPVACGTAGAHAHGGRAEFIRCGAPSRPMGLSAPFF